MLVISAGDIAARIYQPGYSGYRGESGEILILTLGRREKYPKLGQ